MNKDTKVTSQAGGYACGRAYLLAGWKTLEASSDDFNKRRNRGESYAEIISAISKKDPITRNELLALLMSHQNISEEKAVDVDELRRTP